MTPRKMVEAVLRSGCGVKVPFIVYDCILPKPRTPEEMELRKRGMCLLDGWPVIKSRRPNVREKSVEFTEGSRRFVRTFYETPAGKLETLSEPAGFTVWEHEKMWKSPEDYKPLLAYIRDEVLTPNYDEYLEAYRKAPGDVLFRADLGYEPMQSLMSENLMDAEDFCVEWMERRDEILKLYAALSEKRMEKCRLFAESPAEYMNIGGNVIPEVISPENFVKYYLPHYGEEARILHEAGKVIGCHFDADMTQYASMIAGASLDYIEAFTPAPDTRMTLRAARDAWPGKVIWLNFPSSVHLKPSLEVEKTTVDMLAELESAAGIIMGVTEDMPSGWAKSCGAIMSGLERHAREYACQFTRPN